MNEKYLLNVQKRGLRFDSLKRNISITAEVRAREKREKYKLRNPPSGQCVEVENM